MAPQSKKKAKNYETITFNFENIIDALLYNKSWRKRWDGWMKNRPHQFFRNFRAGYNIFFKVFGADLSKYDPLFIAQSHLDASWLWDKHTSIRRALVTFQNNLGFLQKYPQFTFSMTGPQYWDWVKHYRPEMLEKIKPFVKTGRFEQVGGMWIEPDVQIPCGESLVRQCLIGQRWYLKNLGAISRVGVLSDCFGFCWTLPQILLKSGTKYFWTNKLSWSHYNRWPFANFYWQGPDGSKVLAHNFLFNWQGIIEWKDYQKRARIPKQPGLTFSYANSPAEIENALSNDYVRTMPIFYGWGDGGMGPFEEEIGLATAIAQGFKGKFTNMYTLFKRHLEPNVKNIPIWNDELYLERHRGIFTSHAKVKKLNRDGEISLLNAEILSSLAMLVDPSTIYPAETLDKAWKLLMFNQFHDILPGSSIPEVYLEAEAAMQGVIEDAHTIIHTQMKKVASKTTMNPPKKGHYSTFVVNTLPWTRNDVQEVTFFDVDQLPQKGAVIVDSAGVQHNVLKIFPTGETVKLFVQWNNFPALAGRWVHLIPAEEGPSQLVVEEDSTHYIFKTPTYTAKVNKQLGYLTSLVLAKTQKELLKGPANKVKIYKDYTRQTPAWDISGGYTTQKCPLPSVKGIKLEKTGSTVATLTIQRYSSHAKYLTQTLTFNALDSLIRMTFDADWTEPLDLVKVAFPINAGTKVVTGEIPFGNIDRPLTPRNRFDDGRWEWPALRWVDQSSEDGSGGLTLINNGKYGFSNLESVVAMSLFRTSKYPKPIITSFIRRIPKREYPKYFDLGRQFIEYAIYPHTGTWREAEAWRKAIEFNHPLLCADGPLDPSSASPKPLISDGFIQSCTPNFRVSAIKRPEDANTLPPSTIVIRGVEMCGTDGSVDLEFHPNLKIKAAQEVDLLEMNPQPVSARGNKLTFNCGKYEIKTFLVTFA